MQSNIPFSPHILQLWFARVSDSTMDIEKTVQALLSVSELKRLDLIKGHNKRREYLLSRALMRHVLSRYFHPQEQIKLFLIMVQMEKRVIDRTFLMIKNKQNQGIIRCI